MRIRVSGQDFSEAFEIDMLSDTDFTDVQPVTDRSDSGHDGETKLIDGKPVYRVPCVVVDKSNGYQITGASVRVHEKPKGKIGRGFDKHLSGTIYITPWVNRGTNRLAVSIVADGLADGLTQAGK